MIRWLRLSLFLASAAASSAAPPPELAPGLLYFRIHDLGKESAELQTALSKEAVVLDLRSTPASPDAAAALAQHLEQSKVSAHGLRLVLINPVTSADIVEALTHPHPRQLTIGPRSAALTPDVAVSTTVEEDRRAYDAFTTGTPLDKLISSNPEKKRFDEAALARTRANAAAAAEREVEDAESGDTDAAPHPVSPVQPTTTQPTVPHDLVLERAGQIFRALAAVKR